MALTTATLFAPALQTSYAFFLFIPPIATQGIEIFDFTCLTSFRPTGLIPGFVGVEKTGPTPI